MSPHEKEKNRWRRLIRRQEGERYALEQSPLFRMRSVHSLAALMGVSTSVLDGVCRSPRFSPTRSQFPRPGKTRRVNEPLGLTMHMHYRLWQLLDRVRRPLFLQSATRGRGCLSNAAQHANGYPAASADIKLHFESTTKRRLMHFFGQALSMAPDLSGRLASLCTVNDHLPLGSPVSPLLAYWAHAPFFDAVHSLCESRDVTMTLYGDDLCFSGDAASRALLAEVEALSRAYGVYLPRWKQHTFARGAAKVFAGVEICKERLAFPKTKHRQIFCGVRQLATLTPADREHKVKQLQGQIGAAGAVDPKAAEKLQRLLREALLRLGQP